MMPFGRESEMKNCSYIKLVGLAGLLLTACGGGGGIDSSGVTPAPAPTQIALDASNAEAVSGKLIETHFRWMN